jgi:RND family efflux transporter MFP subunit
MSRAPAFASVVLAAILSLSAGFAQAQQPAAPALAAATPATTPAAAPAAVPPPAPAPAAPRGAAPKPEAGMEMSALVMADNEATLSAQMAGKINRIRFAIGDGFPARAVLVEFDCAEPRARLDALNAEYLGARETHLAKLRLQGLGAAGDLEVTLAAAAGERAKSQVKQQEAQMSFCTILAPYAGRVVRLKARQAESVAPNQPVMEIVATARLKAAVHVPSALAVRLKQGSPLSIDIRESGRRYAAKVAKLNARVDGVSQSLELQVVFVGDTTGLLPGMIGQAVFVEDPGKSN